MLVRAAAWDPCPGLSLALTTFLRYHAGVLYRTALAAPRDQRPAHRHDHRRGLSGLLTYGLCSVPMAHGRLSKLTRSL